MKILEYSIRFVPVTFVMGTIFFLSHQPASELQLLPEIPGLDKLAHAIVYAALAAAALYAAPPKIRGASPYIMGLAVILFCLLYGVGDEFHQSFIPGREPSLGDLLADTVGAGILVTAWLKYLRTNQVPLIRS